MILVIRLRWSSTRRGAARRGVARRGRLEAVGVALDEEGEAARHGANAGRPDVSTPCQPSIRDPTPWPRRRCTPTPVLLPCRRPPLALAGQPRIPTVAGLPSRPTRPPTFYAREPPRFSLSRRAKRGKLERDAKAASSATAPPRIAT